MPYIHCERCGTSCYSNVLSCPKCKTAADRIYTHALAGHESPFSAGDEDVEHEVRDALYGWHSGCVEMRQIKPAVGRETAGHGVPS